MQKFTKVVDSLVSQVPVVVVPCEALSDVATGSERLHELDDVEVRNIDFVMFVDDVLLGDQHTLLYHLVRRKKDFNKPLKRYEKTATRVFLGMSMMLKVDEEAQE